MTEVKDQKTFDPDDPMVLDGRPVQGDPGLMMELLIEEYARMGWDATQIEAIFANPFFRATHGLSDQFGVATVKARIKDVLDRCGVLRFHVVKGGC